MSQKRHKPGLGRQSAHNFLGWHPLDQKQTHDEQDQPVDFLLTRTRATPIQFVGSLITGLCFIAFAAGILLIAMTSSDQSAPLALKVVAFVIASLIALLFLRLGWLSIRRAFVGRRRSPR